MLIPGIPDSREQILKFIRDQNRELQNFIEETTETEHLEAEGHEEDFCKEDEQEIHRDVGQKEFLADSDSDSDMDNLEYLEWEIK